MLDQLLAVQKINTEILLKLVDMKIEMDALQDLVKTLSTDTKELQDSTGITYERWKATRKEQNELFIRDRIAYHRPNEGLMGAQKLAYQELRELHKQEMLKS